MVIPRRRRWFLRMYTAYLGQSAFGCNFKISQAIIPSALQHQLSRNRNWFLRSSTELLGGVTLNSIFLSIYINVIRWIFGSCFSIFSLNLEQRKKSTVNGEVYLIINWWKYLTAIFSVLLHNLWFLKGGNMVVDISHPLIWQRRPSNPLVFFFSKREKSGDYHDPDKILMRQFGFVFSSIVNVWNGKMFYWI